MATHPKGAVGWRERDNAHAANRMRRRRAGHGRHTLPVGAALTEREAGPVVVEAFAPPRTVERMVLWADQHRQLDCPRYDECLSAACQAMNECRLGHLHTWSCLACDGGER